MGSSVCHTPVTSIFYSTTKVVFSNAFYPWNSTMLASLGLQDWGGLVLADLSHSIPFYPSSHQADKPLFSLSNTLSTEYFATSGPLHIPSPLDCS